MHPDLFHVGGFPVGTYGVCLAAGLLCASLVALRRAQQVGIPSQDVMDLIFYGVIAGIVGSRLAYVVTDLLGERYLLEHPAEIIFSRTNFVFLGGVIVGLPVCAFFARRRGLRFWLVADVLAAALPLGHAFGRVGCFMAGCCYGAPLRDSSLFHFLAVRFPAIHERPAIGPVWPTQLMESAGNLVIFLLLLALWRRRRFNGQTALLYILFYGVLRFSLEFLRGDQERGHFGILSTSQAITLAGVICVPFVWRYLRRTQPVGPGREIVETDSAEEAEPEDRNPAKRKRTHRRGNRR